jgi:glycosyltransferase involved in cell wall biosynthesis
LNYLFVIDDLGSGGAQRQMTNLAIALAELGNSVSFVIYHERDYYVEKLRQNNININYLVKKNPFTRILAFRKHIRNGQYDIVVSFLGVPNFLCELAGLPFRKWKLIVSERSANPIILKSTKSIVLRFFHLFTDRIICNSSSSRRILEKVNPFIPKQKIKVIYNMLDLQKWKPADNYEFRKNGYLTILVPASHRHLKNFTGLLSAILLLNEAERNEIRINWYGNNLTVPFYDDSITKCRTIISENKLEEIVQLYPATPLIMEKMLEADIIGLFSLFEGFPNCICEGMALGKPIIASSVSDIPIVIEDGINGKLCNPKDSQSIANAIRSFLKFDKEELMEMGRLNRIKAIKLFDKNKIILQFLELIK